MNEGRKTGTYCICISVPLLSSLPDSCRLAVRNGEWDLQRFFARMGSSMDSSSIVSSSSDFGSFSFLGFLCLFLLVFVKLPSSSYSSLEFLVVRSFLASSQIELSFSFSLFHLSLVLLPIH